MGAVSVIVIWGLTGRIFDYSDTWQLIINTGTTIVTFLMVFLIQNTQNRDSKAMQLKLDEIIRSLSGARNHLIDLETLSDEDLQQLQDEFQRLRKLSESKTVAGRRADRRSNSSEDLSTHCVLIGTIDHADPTNPRFAKPTFSPLRRRTHQALPFAEIQRCSYPYARNWTKRRLTPPCAA